MDPIALVLDKLSNGREIVEQLNAGGLGVPLAFWVKRTDSDDWRLYLSMPLVDEQGSVGHIGH